MIEAYLREYWRGAKDLGLDDKRYVRLICSELIGDPAINGPCSNTALTTPSNLATSHKRLEALKGILDMDSNITTDVLHRARCYALVDRRKDGFSFAYSADTMPCENLVRAAQGVRVLTHETAFADDKATNALRKTRSTQGIAIGCKARAEQTLLTHFSQRYPKMPALNQEGSNDVLAVPASFPKNQQIATGYDQKAEELPMTTVSCAYDHLDIHVGQLCRMKHYMQGVLHVLLHMDAAGDENDTDPTLLAWRESVVALPEAERMVNNAKQAKAAR